MANVELNLFQKNPDNIQIGFRPLDRSVVKAYKLYASNLIDSGYQVIKDNIPPYIDPKADLESILLMITRQEIADALSINEDIDDTYYLKMTYYDTSDVEQPVSLSDVRPLIVLPPRRARDTHYRNWELTVTNGSEYSDNEIDFEWELGRSIDKITIATGGDIRIKFNDLDNDYITMFANEEKDFDGNGLEIKKLFIDNKDAGYGSDVSVRVYAVSTFLTFREVSRLYR